MNDEAKAVADGYAALAATIASARSEATDELRARDPARWAAAHVRIGDALMEFKNRRRFTFQPNAIDAAPKLEPEDCYLDALEVIGLLPPLDQAALASRRGLALSGRHYVGTAEGSKICAEVARQLPPDAPSNVAVLVHRNLSDALLNLHQSKADADVAARALAAAQEASNRATGASREARWAVLLTLSRAATAHGLATRDRTVLESAVAAARTAAALVARIGSPERFAEAHMALGQALYAGALATSAPAAVATTSSGAGTLSRVFGALGFGARPSVTAPAVSVALPHGLLEEAAEALRRAIDVVNAHPYPPQDGWDHQGDDLRKCVGAVLITLAKAEDVTPAAWLRRQAERLGPSASDAAKTRWAADANAIAIALHHNANVTELNGDQARDVAAVVAELQEAAPHFRAACHALGAALKAREFVMRKHSNLLRPALATLRTSVDVHQDETLAIYWAKCSLPAYERPWSNETRAAVERVKADAARLRSASLWALAAEWALADKAANHAGETARVLADVRAEAARLDDPRAWTAWAKLVLDHLRTQSTIVDPLGAAKALDDVTSRFRIAPQKTYDLWFLAAEAVHKALVASHHIDRATALRADMMHFAALPRRRDNAQAPDTICKALIEEIRHVRFSDFDAARTLQSELARVTAQLENDYSRRHHLRTAKDLLAEPTVKLAHGLLDEILKPVVIGTNVALDFNGRTPDGVRGSKVTIENAIKLRRIGARFHAREAILVGAAIEELPIDVAVTQRLDVSQCRSLRALPDGLEVPRLAARECVSLETLPRGLVCSYLDLSGCSSLRELPGDLKVRHGRLTLRDCARLRELPSGLGPLAQLDIGGCLNITAIPDDLIVTAWIDIGGSGVTALPRHLDGVAIRWRGVPIDDRIAFRPDTLSAQEILAESNTEIRRVMVERFGFDRFMTDAKAEVLDRDRDGAGGPRRLLRIALPGDEPLVCVHVVCPSTQREFMLRVPPQMRSCSQAVAWTAGFDDPSLYRPHIET